MRQIFHRARQSAPAIIVFDELDSFASARGTYTGSGVEHSMVNQLLTEMDGFHSDELVFVVGTTNFVEILDPALLRPGRFEFHLHIPYPDADDRRAILQIYNDKLRLAMTDEALEFAIRRTGEFVEGA
ncbi:MAG: AAA family ATPase, partial [Pirellulaceae bacterium]|nr:AAA family ATPase [Pirellulaceae bacterium]